MSENSLSPSEILQIEVEDNLTNSLKKRRKRSKVRKGKRDLNNPALQAGDNKRHCQYCQLYLTNEHFQDHQGTKKHKRNVRKWKEEYEDENDESLTPTTFSFQALPITAEISRQQSTVFDRKKYESCFDTTNKDKEYVCLVVAYLSLKLALDDEVEDFYITVFNKKWLSYGDIVIEIVKRGVVETRYAIKCKNISNALVKLRSFKEIINTEKEYEKIKDLGNNDFYQNAKFAIFTTAQKPYKPSTKDGSSTEEENVMPSPLTAVTFPIKEKELIDISRKEKAVFEFTSKQGQKILLFTSQQIGDKWIDQLIRDKFDDCSDVVSTEFVRYIKYWSKGEAGGRYSLRKMDTIIKLAQILLQKVIVEPIVPNKITGNNIESYNKWNEIIDEVDLTILKNNPYIISRISDPIIKIIESIFGITIRPNRLVNLDDQMVKSLAPEIKAYLFETVQNLKEPVTLTKFYYTLWKANEIPLLLNDKAEMKDIVFKIISFLKQKGFKRKFIFLSEDPASVIPTNDLKIFKNLRDIKDNIKLSEIIIPVSNGPDLNLEQIVYSNPFFLKWVTPDIYLNLTLQKCSFKGVAPKHYAEQGDDVQIIVNNEELLEEIYQGILQSLNIQEEEEEYQCISFGNLRGFNPALLSVNTLK